MNKKVNKNNEELVSNITFQELTNRIAEYLYMYSLKTHQFFTKENPKNMGGVAFWLETQTKDDQIITSLMYNVHPSKWNKNRVIIDYELEEKHFMEYILRVPFHY